MTSIPGSKPKKFITKTVLTNPSLISLSVTSLFNPQNKQLPIIYQALGQKKKNMVETFNRQMEQSIVREKPSPKLSPIKEIDSLKQAESEFLRRKMSKMQMQVSPPIQQIIAPGYKDDSAMQKKPIKTPLSLTPYHYTSQLEIKAKQRSSYNIINNI